MTLTGEQYQQLTNILMQAFPTPAKLTQMVRFRLDKNLAAIALGEDLQEIVFKLIGAAETERWTPQLISAARDSNPGNPDLLAFAQQFGLATRLLTSSPALGLTPIKGSRVELEKIITKTNSFLEINAWREQLGKIESQVCRIEIASKQGKIFGTGFLLAPDVVMTNYHVMETVITGQLAEPSDVTVRFDYKSLADGTTINPGIKYRLASQDWLIDKSPNNQGNRLPQPDELDYALLRVDGSPGYEAIGSKAEPQAPLRGWIKAPTEEYMFSPDTPLFIVQHPEAEPLKLAIDTEAIIGLNENGTSVSYRTNTLAGSSGSPCFNSNWELVALHCGGAFNSTYNFGTPFSKILQLLEKRGFRDALGEQPL
ncbi:MAG: effector-associated domain EAD1-containing protein [Nostocaceae cyanobacterium]|nr:effector-associated domain EAD1-containing protein [Nostocaceae cyanobacterium]